MQRYLAGSPMAGLFAQVRGHPGLISILLVAADLEAGLQQLLSSPQLARMAADAAVGRPPAPSHAPAPSGQRLQQLPQELREWKEGTGLMRLHAAAMKVGVCPAWVWECKRASELVRLHAAGMRSDAST